MLKNIIRFFCVVIFLAFISVQAQEQSVNGGKVVFSDPAEKIKVKKSQPEFKIILKSNPSTGFSWSIKKCDDSLIEKVSDKFHSPIRSAAEPQRVGAPGYEKWIFKVKPEMFINQQEAAITLVYKRPWENKSAKQLTFKVVTENAN